MSGVDNNANVSVLVDEVDDNQPADYNYHLVTSMKEYLIEEIGNCRCQALAEYVLYKTRACCVVFLKWITTLSIVSLVWVPVQLLYLSAS
jgi:tRNA(Ile2) C34 agmatinyltransferase TiaS